MVFPLTFGGIEPDLPGSLITWSIYDAIFETFDQVRRYLDLGESCLAFGLDKSSILEPRQSKKGDLAFVILQLPIA